MPDGSDGPRKARARAMGFDVDSVLYHGTNADISEVTPLRGNASSVFGSGFYLSRSPASASRWAASKGGEGQNVLPLVIKPEGILRSAPMTEADAAKISAYLGRRVNAGDPPPLLSIEKRGGSVSAGLKEAGFTGFEHQGPGASGLDIVIFDPSNIRSVNAAFDPEKSGSSTLLAAAPFAAVSGVGAGTAMGEDD